MEETFKVIFYIAVFILFVIGYVAVAEFAQFMLALSVAIWIPGTIIYWIYSKVRGQG